MGSCWEAQGAQLGTLWWPGGVEERLNSVGMYVYINLYAGQEAKLELDMEQQTGSIWGREYVKVVYCYPAYLTYMQSTS